jgi:hypothetical protein
MNTTLKTSEIAEAVAALAAQELGTRLQNEDAARLMTLVEIDQSEYEQKRFWGSFRRRA